MLLHVELPIFLAQSPEGEAGVLEDDLLHLLLAVTFTSYGGGVLGSEREQRTAEGEQIVAARLAHGPRHDLEHAQSRVAVVILDVVRPLAAHHRHCARVEGEAVLDVERFPRALRFVLRHAVGDLGGIALGRSIAGPGQAAAHVHEEQPHRAPDGHVGAKALAEGVVAGVDGELARDGAIDDHDGRHGMRGRLDGVEVEGGVRQGLDGRDDHGHVLGLAARHDCVDGDALHRGLALPRGQDGDHLEGIAIGPAQELLHLPVRGRHHGQAVRPAALLIDVVDGAVGGVQPERLGGRPGRRHFVTARTTTSMARSAFFTTSSSRMPPSGCGMRARGRSASPRFFASSLASCSNSLVPITTVGMPCCSSTMAPWILHDVHDPQSALPTRTKSHVVRSAMIEGDGGPAIPFSRFTTSRTPWSSLRRATTASISVPALALLLSRMPTRVPLRVPRRGASPAARIRGSAVGSYSSSPVSLMIVSSRCSDTSFVVRGEDTPQAAARSPDDGAGLCYREGARDAAGPHARLPRSHQMTSRFRVLPVAAMVIAGLLAAGCSSLKVVVDRDNAIAISPGSTWAWGPEPTEKRPDELDPRVNNSIIHGRVKRAVEVVLAQKGFRQTEAATADFLVFYRVGVRDSKQIVTQAVPVGPYYWGGYGWGWGMYGPPPVMTSQEVTYTEGALMIDITQRSTGKLAFRSIGLDQNVTGADGTEEQIEQSVSKMLKTLP